MNFYKALQHAFIGYGIRRKSWATDIVLYFDHDTSDLHYLKSKSHATISDFDYHSTDWETI